MNDLILTRCLVMGASHYSARAVNVCTQFLDVLFHSHNRLEALLVRRQWPEKPVVALSVASVLLVVLLAFMGTFLTFSVMKSPYSPGSG